MYYVLFAKCNLTFFVFQSCVSKKKIIVRTLKNDNGHLFARIRFPSSLKRILSHLSLNQSSELKIISIQKYVFGIQIQTY